MIIYVVIIQPDGDWDHLAEIDSVWDSKEAAENRRSDLAGQQAAYSRYTHQVAEVPLNKKRVYNPIKRAFEFKGVDFEVIMALADHLKNLQNPT